MCRVGCFFVRIILVGLACIFLMLCGTNLLFFFKQKTAYEMRISDWSSDVCSSDLVAPGGLLSVLATDPGAAKDFIHFCDATGCDLVESDERPDGVLSFLIRKPG